HTPGHSVVRLASGGDRLTFAGDAVFQVGFEHPDWYNGFEHDPEEAARIRVRLLRELAANRESLVATHLSFPSVCHVAVGGDVFRWVPGPWEYLPLVGLGRTRQPHAVEQLVDCCLVRPRRYLRRLRLRLLHREQDHLAPAPLLSNDR